MEFLRIGDSKIKIVLNPDELKKHGISVGDDGCSAGNRRAVWEILEDARSKVGFDPEGDKILVQFYPTRDGGCEIFVTKLGILPASAARFVTRSDRVTLISKARRYFLFSSYGDIVNAISAIAEGAADGLKATLLGQNNTYILAVDEIGDGYDGELSVLREFSSSATEELFVYALEHFDTLYSDAPIKKIVEK